MSLPYTCTSTGDDSFSKMDSEGVGVVVVVLVVVSDEMEALVIISFGDITSEDVVVGKVVVCGVMVSFTASD